jgi:hypothetical protein
MEALASYNILFRMMLLFDMIVRLSALNFYLLLPRSPPKYRGHSTVELAATAFLGPQPSIRIEEREL